MCRVLEVSVSGYYAWVKRPLSRCKREDGELTRAIVAVFTSRRGVYGSPRIVAELRAQGLLCGRRRVMRLMHEAHLSARSRKRRPTTTRRASAGGERIAANLLGRDFTAPAPNRKWVADVTTIPTQEGWMYLAVVLDLFSRMVVGWAMDSTQDERLVEAAFQMALGRREPQAHLVHHSDRTGFAALETSDIPACLQTLAVSSADGRALQRNARSLLRRTP
jgi:putative transposase